MKWFYCLELLISNLIMNIYLIIYWIAIIQTKYNLLFNDSGADFSPRTSATNFDAFLAYWRMPGTLIDPHQLT